jgi:phage terminase small subunit
MSTLDEIRAAINRAALELSVPHKRFADEWLANGHNGTRAYMKFWKRSSPKAAAISAHRLLNRADVKSYIDLCNQYTTDELLDHMSVTKERILSEESKLAFIDIRKMFDINGNFLPPQFWPEEIARAAAGVDIDQRWDTDAQRWRYKYKIRLNDKGRALQRLETVLGMNKAPEMSDKDTELIKGFFNQIDGDTRGKLPVELEEDD